MQESLIRFNKFKEIYPKRPNYISFSKHELKE